MLSCFWVEQKASAEEGTAGEVVEYYSECKAWFLFNPSSFDCVLLQKPFLKNCPHFLCPTVLFLISVLMHQKDVRIKNEDTKEINLIPVDRFLL